MRLHSIYEMQCLCGATHTRTLKQPTHWRCQCGRPQHLDVAAALELLDKERDRAAQVIEIDRDRRNAA